MARSGSLSKVSSDDLQAELKRRARHARSLEKKRDKLLAQLDEVEEELEYYAVELSGVGGGGGAGRKRAKNKENLADSLVRVLKNKTMSVTEVADAVQRSGYRTTSPNFRTIVNQTLIKDKRFKRVDRGQYTAK